MIDTFSANSLKILDKNPDEFKNIYEYNLSLYKKDARALVGQKFHSLICAYLNNIPITKILLELKEEENNTWLRLEEILKNKKNNFIKCEYPFLIKNEINKKPYYLTGRMDAVLKENDFYIIYDWKTLNLPKNPNDDLQSVVYLYCGNTIFETEKIKIKYLSIEKLDSVEVAFKSRNEYKQKIEGIIKKYYL